MRFLFILFLMISNSYADGRIPAQISFSLGSISTNYKESQSNLVATDGSTSTTTQTPYAGTASAMPLDACFEYFPNLKRSYFLKGGGPLLASSADRNFYVTTGANFYFGLIGAPVRVSDSTMEIQMTPKLRYYAGPAIGITYLVYNTKSQTKNDILLDLGGQGGGLYALNQKWGLKAELDISRQVGALVSATTLKILFGTTYNLNL